MAEVSVCVCMSKTKNTHTLADGELLMMAVRTPMACTVMQSEPFSQTYKHTHEPSCQITTYTYRATTTYRL